MSFLILLFTAGRFYRFSCSALLLEFSNFYFKFSVFSCFRGSAAFSMERERNRKNKQCILLIIWHVFAMKTLFQNLADALSYREVLCLLLVMA